MLVLFAGRGPLLVPIVLQFLAFCVYGIFLWGSTPVPLSVLAIIMGIVLLYLASRLLRPHPLRGPLPPLAPRLG